jgi:hypothetical protein
VRGDDPDPGLPRRSRGPAPPARAEDSAEEGRAAPASSRRDGRPCLRRAVPSEVPAQPPIPVRGRPLGAHPAMDGRAPAAGDAGGRPGGAGHPASHDHRRGGASPGAARRIRDRPSLPGRGARPRGQGVRPGVRRREGARRSWKCARADRTDARRRGARPRRADRSPSRTSARRCRGRRGRPAPRRAGASGRDGTGSPLREGGRRHGAGLRGRPFPHGTVRRGLSRSRTRGMVDARGGGNARRIGVLWARRIVRGSP